MMTTDYDQIAEDYQLVKAQPWRAAIESYSLLELIGDVRRRSAVDLACGEGFHTRRLARFGADPVLGVDLSERMIDLARAAESACPLGVDYLVADVRELRLPRRYDLVVAAYLLNYSRNPGELAAMCRSVASAAAPGGRFVAVNVNPDLDPSSVPSYRRYGFELAYVGEQRSGLPITWRFFNDGGEFTIENYLLDRETHEQALRAAGFREIHWHPPQVSPTGRGEFGDEFWSLFLENPPICLIDCRL
ncbi:MAG: class I SAM-dependent methyltransferase [Methylotetracoccus sp.]